MRFLTFVKNGSAGMTAMPATIIMFAPIPPYIGPPWENSSDINDKFTRTPLMLKNNVCLKLLVSTFVHNCFCQAQLKLQLSFD